MPAGDGFGRRGRGEIQRALQYAGEASGLKFAAVVRDVGGAVREWAERTHARMADPPRSVLLVVDPVAHRMEIVTGQRAGARIDDAACVRVAASAVRIIGRGDLVRGLVSALQQLGQIAGPPRRPAVPDPVGLDVPVGDAAARAADHTGR